MLNPSSSEPVLKNAKQALTKNRELFSLWDMKKVEQTEKPKSQKKQKQREPSNCTMFPELKNTFSEGAVPMATVSKSSNQDSEEKVL